MLAAIASATLNGAVGRPVSVEVHVSNGLPGFTIVGLPDAAVREARDRVRAAILSSGLSWPMRRITANLAPSGVRKGGAGLDLPIAIGLLVAAGELSPSCTEGFAFCGELGPTAPPASPAPLAPAASPAPTAPPTAPSAGISPSVPPPSVATPSVAAPSVAKPQPIPKVTPLTSGRVTTRLAKSSDEPVRLPSGSVVGASFVAGLLSAMALGRLRRRHAYRHSTPEAGVDLVPDPPQPTLRQLVSDRSSVDDHEGADEGRHVVISEVLDFDPGNRQDPGRIDFGVRSGTTVSIEATDLSGVAFDGAVTDEVLRALISALVVHAGPGAAEVALTASLTERLLPRLSVLRAIRETQDADGVARVVEAEAIARTRRLDAVEAPDAQTFRAQNPENPLPLLLALVEGVSEESIGRWTAMLGGLPRLGIGVVFIGPGAAADGTVVFDADRTATVHGRPELATRLDGVEAFGLDEGEAVELLGAFAESHRECEPEELSLDVKLATSTPSSAPGGVTEEEGADDEVSLPIVVDGHYNEGSPTHAPLAQQWPANGPVKDGTPRAVSVQLFGPYGITAYGQPVETGLRRRSKMLLAWYMLRPDGATPEETIDALWPETPPEDIHKAFWRALGDLRTRLSNKELESIEVLSRVGEHYLPAATEIECDLWTFQCALGEASRVTDDKEAGPALRRATDAYTGDLLVGSDYPWVEPVRRDLHRRCLDALLRLAEIENQVGNPENAVATLEKAIEMDRYAEEPYRRLMILQAARDRPGTVAATWQLLQSRLSDLDLEVEDATSRLYHSLTGTRSKETRNRHPVRAS
jgi:DNA-binding SARP family transcriptional activator